MRKFIIVLLLSLVVGLNAQLQWDKSMPVRQSVNVEWTRASATIPDGSVVYVWSDVRNGDRDIFAQKVDGDGNMLWGEESGNSAYPGMKEGVMINGEADRQEDLVIIETGDGQTVVAWVDYRNNPLEGDIYAQKLDEDGNILWDEAGVPLCLAEEEQISLNIVSNEAGGALIIWVDQRLQSAPDIYGTHILADGTIAEGWEADGNPIVVESNSQGQHTFWEDGQGGAVVAWADDRNPGGSDIYMQRIAANGDLLWAENGNLLVGAANAQSRPKVTRTSDDKFFFAWLDKRNEASGDIYGQLVDLDGNFLWEEELEILVGAGIQRNPRIQITSDDAAVVAWEDGAAEITYKNIHVQKINQAGEKLWAADGLPVVTAAYDQLNPRLDSDDAGGIWIIWDDSRDGGFPNVDIYAQQVNAAGEIQLETDGLQVCSQFSEQFSPLIKKSGDRIFTIWGNGNNEAGARTIQVQILDEAGEEILPENGKVVFGGMIGNASDYTILENGENPAVVWEDSRDSHLASQIYYQILNPDASFQLEKNGVSITEMTGSDQQELHATLVPGEDKIAVVWTEGRIDGVDYTYAQLLDFDGNRLWGEQGTVVCPNEVAQKNPKIAYVDGQYFISWQDTRANFDYGIYSQIFDENGEAQLDPAGVEIADLAGEDELMTVVDDYIIWKISVNWNTINIHVAKLDETGNMAAGWPEDGLEVVAAAGIQEKAQAIMTDEGLLLIWSDKRNDGIADIYGQIVTADGNILWEENGAPLVTSENDQIASNPVYNDGLFLAWDDLEGGIYDVYMQSYNSDASTNWAGNGIEIIAEEQNQKTPDLVSNGESFLVSWEHYFGGGEAGVAESDIHTQWVSAAGEKQWDNAGLALTTAIKDQKKPISAYAGDDSAFIIWEDARSSGKNDIYNIYAQKVAFEVLNSDENELNLQQSLQQNYPNPFNPTTTIKFSVATENQPTELTIYNLKGQKVKTLVDAELSAGRHTATWNGKDSNQKNVASGVYFYQLSNPQQTETRKMILMK
ncbi:MAG: T9SS type A sorting domain-containing protein [Candidatus Cloacimonadales bacterium]